MAALTKKARLRAITESMRFMRHATRLPSIEAATALAVQPGNRVTVSYRRPAFTRLKQRNEQRIARFLSEGRIHVLFNSQVKSIEPGAAILQVEEADTVREISVPANTIFVLAGGEPPYPLLKKIGIRFHGEEQPQTQCVHAEKATTV